MRGEERLEGGAAGNHQDGGREQNAGEFQAALREAALKMLRDRPGMINRAPELTRELRGLVNSRKCKAPAGFGDRAIETAILEAGEEAREEFRRKPNRGGGAKPTQLDEPRGGSSADERDARGGGRAKAFPEECIRGTCKDWIETLKPRGEWPVAFLFWEWRMIHSMAIARSGWYGNSKPRFPHCHDLLIGESGITHKNTSINRAVALIRIMRPHQSVFKNVSSIEGVIDALADSRQSIGLIAAAEYSYLVATGKRQGTSNLVPMLNDAYDGEDPLTITRKKSPVIREPFLNLVGGCTPAWIGEYADKEGADLGRFNRYVVFYADQHRDIPNPQNLRPDEEQEFARLFGEKLAELSRQPRPIEFESAARAWSDDWYMRDRKRVRSLPDHLRKLMERADDQVKIQALIYAAADGRRTISEADVQAAAKLIEWSGENKLRLFGEVEFNSDQRLERRMLAWIDRGGGTMTALYRDLGNVGRRETVYRKLQVMVWDGSCTLSRPLDQPRDGPLVIFPPKNRRNNGE